jgi:hypothetical protein
MGFTEHFLAVVLNDEDPIGTALRDKHRRQRFEDKPICLFCGYTDPVALTPVSKEWLEARGVNVAGAIENHHVLGIKHDLKFTVPLCLICHREVTEGLRQTGVTMEREPNPRVRLKLMLKALSFFLEHLAVAIRGWAEML